MYERGIKALENERNYINSNIAIHLARICNFQEEIDRMSGLVKKDEAEIAEIEAALAALRLAAPAQS